MPTLKIYGTIQDQIIKLHASVEKVAKQPGGNLIKVFSALKSQITESYNAAFKQLLAGQALPFFRQNFIEVSANILKLSNCLMKISCPMDALPPNEKLERSCIQGTFDILEEILSMYLDTWTFLGTDIEKAGAEIGKAIYCIQKLEQYLDSKIYSAPGNSIQIYPYNTLIDSLYSTDLSIRKLIVILNI
jgi:hypothetical protein